MLEIKDDGSVKYCYLFEVKDGAVKIWPKAITSPYAKATADNMDELPEDLKNAMMLCLTRPLGGRAGDDINVPWREKGVDLRHYMEDGRERWELSFDVRYRLTEILKEPTP